MSISRIKITGKQMLMGDGVRAAILMCVTFALAAALGLITAGVNFIIGSRSVAGKLSSVYENLPGIVRIAACVLLLIVTALVIFPLKVGRSAWFLSPALGIKRHYSRVMYWLKPSKALRSAGYVAALGCIKAFWALIFLSPGLFLFGGTVYSAVTQKYELNLLIAVCGGSFALLLVGIGFFSVMLQRYFLVIPILVKDPGISFTKAVRLSGDLMNGNCLRTAKMKWSFFFWFLSCLLILPAIYVIPYYRQTCACCQADLMPETKTRKAADPA